MAVSKVEKQNNPLPWIFGVTLGGMLLVGGWTYFISNRQSKSPEQLLNDYTVSVNRETLNLQIRASGTVEPVQSVNISPKNPGRIVKLLVDQGVIVKQGQPIAIMENQELFAQGVQAESNVREIQATIQEKNVQIQGDLQRFSSQLVQAEARLEESRQRIPQQIAQVRSQLKESESRLQLARSQVERNQKLLEEGAVTQDQFEQLVTQYIVAQADIQRQIERLQELQATGLPEIQRLEAEIQELKIALEEREVRGKAEIDKLTANLQGAEATLEIAKIQYQDTFIRAPFDGIITQRYATEGAFVTPTTSASSTASATSSSIVALARGLEIVAKVPEIDLSQIKVGQPVDIIADAYPTETFQGVVRAIAPEAIVEQNVTSFEVKIDILSGQEKLLSKMNVEVNFIGEKVDNALVVPTVAIVTEKGKTGVMIPDEKNEPKFQPVTIGLSVDDKTQVLSGLFSGQRIFIDLPPKN